jgi:hypothetical protein
MLQCATAAEGLERTFDDTSGLGQLACSALRLLNRGEPRTARIELDAWKQAHLDIESVEPATLELVGGRIEHVSLALHGPITLRVLDSEQLSDLRVASDGAAQIELTRVRGAAVAIEAPQASLVVRRSSLDRLSVSVQRIELESSFVSDAAWRAEWLNAADVTLLRVRAEAERSVLSACDVSMARFSACRSWTSVQGHFTDVQLAACDEEISVYGSAMARAQLEGDLLLDGASLSAAVLGLGEVGAITSWDTQLTNITFCADQHSLNLGGSSSVRCGHCDLAQEPLTPDACIVAGSKARTESSESCVALDVPPLCAEPQPERMRPPRM